MAKQLFRKKIRLGTKQSEEAAFKKSSKEEMYYRSMYIDSTKLPLEPEDVGKTFDAQIKLKVKGVSQSTNEGGSNLDYSFDIMEIAFEENR